MYYGATQTSAVKRHEDIDSYFKTQLFIFILPEKAIGLDMSLFLTFGMEVSLWKWLDGLICNIYFLIVMFEF